MNIAIICFSKHGENTGNKIKELLCDRHNITLECKSKFTSTTIDETLSQWISHTLYERDAIIFVGSCGIAVRTIAPFIKSKKTDPAVIVIDELGNFVIPILSGHLGGANDLSHELSQAIGATAVITTGTDVNGKLAPDVFAKNNNCKIDNMKAAEQIAAAIIHGESVSLYTNMDIEGNIPSYIKVRNLDDLSDDAEYKIIVSPFKYHKQHNINSMWIIPRSYTMGVGCRRGTSKALVEDAIDKAISDLGIDRRAIISLGSIDLKSDEVGLLEAAECEKLNIEFFTEEELRSVIGDFTTSQFVKGITGVDCVCERSAAMLAGEDYKMVRRKTVYDKVTVAVALKKGILKFE